MFATVIIFPMPATTDWDALAATAQKRADTYYRTVPGLLSKSFVINREQGEYGGVYAWDSAQSFEAFRESEAFRTALAKFGEPEIRTFEVPAYVAADEVTVSG